MRKKPVVAIASVFLALSLAVTGVATYANTTETAVDESAVLPETTDNLPEEILETSELPENQTADPVITVSDSYAVYGKFSNMVTVSVNCTTTGAKIYYTLDGSEPTTSSVRASGWITYDQTQDLRVIAVANGKTPSSVVLRPALEMVEEPTVPQSGNYVDPIEVSFSEGTEGAAYYYRIGSSELMVKNGDHYEPSPDALLYEEPFTISEDTDLYVVAVKDGMLRRDLSYQYRFNMLGYAEAPEQDEDGIYQIGTMRELAWFLGLVGGELEGIDADPSASAKLTADIDMTGIQWKMVTTPFTGTLDGDGHSIVNFIPDAEFHGLFARNEGTIKNLTLRTASYYRKGQYYGTFCKENAGTISNCVNEISYAIRTTGIEGSGRDNVVIGGICAENEAGGIVEYCINKGNIRGDRYTIGGIVGRNFGTVRYCANTGVINVIHGGAQYVGGIVGQQMTGGRISDSYNTNIMTLTAGISIAYSDMFTWGSFESGLITGWDARNDDSRSGAAARCYYIDHVILKGDALEEVPLSETFHAYAGSGIGDEMTGGQTLYGMAGFIGCYTSSDKTYYAFNDITNDQILVLDLSGAPQGNSKITIDASDPDIYYSAEAYTGNHVQYRQYKTFNFVEVPRDITSVRFIGTKEIRDYTYFINSEGGKAFTVDNAAAVLERLAQEWPAGYEVVAAACTGLEEAEETAPIHVAVSLDKAVLGGGFIIKPTLVETAEGTQASVVLTDLLKDAGLECSYTGSVENGFYLSKLSDDTNDYETIPDTIKTALDSSEMPRLDNVKTVDGMLGEFDYSDWSGWMYSVNGRFPNVGASGYHLSDGEVMRWQFTLYGYGADINRYASEWGLEPLTELADKEDLTYYVAVLRSKLEDSTLEADTVYEKALEVLGNWSATQKEVDLASEALCTAYADYLDVSADVSFSRDLDSNGQVLEIDQEADTLMVAVAKDQAGSLSYQWYQNDTASYEGAKPITEATTRTFTPNTSKAGTTYYFVKATFRQLPGRYVAKDIYSAIAPITVKVPASPEPQGMLGDANGDEKININDIVFIRGYIQGSRQLTEDQKALADVNGDGSINVNDIVRIRSFILGKISSF